MQDTRYLVGRDTGPAAGRSDAQEAATGKHIERDGAGRGQEKEVKRLRDRVINTSAYGSISTNSSHTVSCHQVPFLVSPGLGCGGSMDILVIATRIGYKTIIYPKRRVQKQ